MAKILVNKLKYSYKFIYPEEIKLSYGCMIFSRYKITHYNEYEYSKTLMGRKLCCIVIEYNMMIQDETCENNQYIVNPQNLVIATSHFESEFKKFNDIYS
jgi:hypothetical protein